MKALFIAVSLATLVLPLAQAGAQDRRQPPPERPCGATAAELPKEWEGQVFAIDGATLAGVGLKQPLRIWGVQAPELRDAAKGETVPGMRARAALEDLLGKSDHKVKCRPTKFDRACRLIAQCTLQDGGDIGGALIAGGMAYGFDLDEALPWESRAGQRYAAAEAEARKTRRGLWKDWLGEK